MRFWMVLLGGYTAAALGAPARPTLDSVETLTRGLMKKAAAETRSLTMEETLAAIGAKYPQLRGSFSLLHDSESRQKASMEFPRVISFAPDGRFLLAFNGDPKALGYPELEMAEFDDDEDAFHFRRIVFEPPKDYPHLREYRDIKGYPAIQPIDEGKCKECHGNDLRPNWESYALWDGTYFRDDHHRHGRKWALSEEGPEHAGFDLFFTRQSDKGRYTFLQGLKERYTPPIAYSTRLPESQMTQVLGYLNYRRVARLIRESDDYEWWKYAILAAIYDCPDFESYLPRPRICVCPIVEDTRERFEKDANRYHLQHEHEQMGKIRAVFEGRGIPMEKWSMAFRRDMYSFVTPGGSVAGFLSTILMEHDPELEPFRFYRLSEGETDYGPMVHFTKTWTGSWTTMVAPECKALYTAAKKALEPFERREDPEIPPM